MGPPLLDALVDAVIERLLDEHGAVSVREALSAIALAYVAELDDSQKIEVHSQLFTGAIGARIVGRVVFPGDLVNVSVNGEPGLARLAPERKLDA